MHEQVSVTFDKREDLCILMQYEIELIYTFGITAFKCITLIFPGHTKTLQEVRTHYFSCTIRRYQAK